MMKFYKTTDITQLSLILSSKISRHLSQGRVLWLIGGGSVIDIAVQTAKNLSHNKNLNNLTVTLTDERFGAVGHSDSNWQQLLDKGFRLEGANLKQVLEGKNIAQTAKAYGGLLMREIARADYSVALGGIGADGHIFGIKAHSPALDSRQAVVGYKWQDYTRLTPTVQLIRQIDEIVIYAAGAEKHSSLDRIEEVVSAREQPAQLLKQAKQVSIYNNYKGERL